MVTCHAKTIRMMRCFGGFDTGDRAQGVSPREILAEGGFCNLCVCVRLWLNPHRRLSVSYTWWYLCLCAGVAVSLLQESADAINEGAYDGDGERHVS